MFLNIIVNAAQAIAAQTAARAAPQAPPGARERGERRRGRIRASTRADGAWVEVRIADTGDGIPVHVRPRVFEPFYTTRAVGAGTGQGLAIAHGVVERHGGSIAFETELGAGTTFVVRLPIAGPGAGVE